MGGAIKRAPRSRRLKLTTLSNNWLPSYGDIVNALITERQIRPVVYRKLRRMSDRVAQRRKCRADNDAI